MAIKHRIRTNGKGKTKVVELTARTAILQHCSECFGFKTKEVKGCTSTLCALYAFRCRGKAESTIKK